MKFLNLDAYRGKIEPSRVRVASFLPINSRALRSVPSLDKIWQSVEYGFLWLKMMKRQHINKQKILERDLYICAYCLGSATEVEHVVPWNWTHNNDEDNLVASCKDCNSIAGGRIFSSFDEKRAYILVIRTGRKWTRKLAIKYQVFRCADCHFIFEPLKSGATNFLCPKCTKKEYKDD
jgi:HNH endonuclease